tara:strand:- start:83825 stop:84937 length:1113 start_codon:yes stop_codon:yes gene_type:complete
MTPTTQTRDTKSLEGRKFRFVVRSAEEAVALIKERLGDNARVLSVNQVGGKGLARFLSSPKLEIVATVPKQEQEPESTPAPQPEKDQPTEAEHTVTKIYTKTASVLEPSEEDSRSRSLSMILDQIGFDQQLFSKIQPRTSWNKLQEMPLQQGLSEIGYTLREAFKQCPTTPTTLRMAFIGTPGVGKTTALCKCLANDVFINNKTPKVLQLEDETPNANEALTVFCEALGVPLLRESIDLDEITEEDLIYFDLPGINIKNAESLNELNRRLDNLNVDTRILTVNAVYDSNFITEVINASHQMKATHLGLTHLDELTFSAKLWPFILKSNLRPLFLTHSQTITGDITESVFEHLIDKTFPPVIRNNLSATNS